MNEDKNHPSTCPACGGRLLSGSKGALCPACMLQAALADDPVLRDEIANGKPFAEVAKERSEDPYATDGGDNMTAKRRDRTEPLDSAIVALKPGVPAIHDDGTSLRILKAEDRVEGGIAPVAEVRDDIAGILQQQQRDALLQQWQDEARVKVDAWEKEHKHAGGPKRAAGETAIPKTQEEEV
jgi:parvulin-like peptidyl-prolyl isomerase